MMIRQVIFDIGGVMLEWTPEAYIKELFPEKPPLDFLQVVYSLFWVGYDGGLYSREELLQQLPEHFDKDRFSHFLNRLASVLRPIPGMADLFLDLKRKGYEIYILSNMPREMAHELNELHPFLKEAHGGVFSYEVNSIKPMPHIYEELLKKYPIEPAKAVFIDDVPVNLRTAKSMGIRGIHFQNPDQVKQALADMGVEL
ncbi:MAG: HAD family phosphatase [Verrucomicrobia bacterium]|nr:HAD family phosphatase [Verrucomicrobiota bacterium]